MVFSSIQPWIIVAIFNNICSTEPFFFSLFDKFEVDVFNLLLLSSFDNDLSVLAQF